MQWSMRQHRLILQRVSEDTEASETGCRGGIGERGDAKKKILCDVTIVSLTFLFLFVKMQTWATRTSYIYQQKLLLLLTTKQRAPCQKLWSNSKELSKIIVFLPQNTHRE